MSRESPGFFTVTADRELAALWRDALTPLGGVHTAVDSVLGALKRLADSEADIVLADLTGTGITTDQLGAKLRHRAPGADLLLALEEGGALDPGVAGRWGVSALPSRAATAADVRAVLTALLTDRDRTRRCRWVGMSRPIRAASDLLLAAAPSDATVLIEGESGTGKELAARALHQNGGRATRPFLALNCSAFPETLLESELFGHEKGAFTDAFGRKKGIFEAAEGGTIFLDEIGETSPAVQARLLRVLEERQVRPIGATRAVPVDFRVVAATNRDLSSAVGEGVFRRDLYYRLAVVQLSLPPLRERRGDVPALLAEHFAAVAKSDLHLVDRLHEEALMRLVDYDWPGNVRELRNFVARAQVRRPTGLIERDTAGELLEIVRTPLNLPVPTGRRSEHVEREMIFAALSELKRDLDYLKRRLDRIAAPTESHAVPGDFASMKQVERERIALALKEAHGNRAQAARLLGIGERTLYRKIRQYGL